MQRRVKCMMSVPVLGVKPMSLKSGKNLPPVGGLPGQSANAVHARTGAQGQGAALGVVPAAGPEL